MTNDIQILKRLFNDYTKKYICSYCHNYYKSIPIKLIKPIAISPVIIKVIPNPLSGAGTFEYAIFSLIAAIPTIAKSQPTPDPKP